MTLLRVKLLTRLALVVCAVVAVTSFSQCQAAPDPLGGHVGRQDATPTPSPSASPGFPEGEFYPVLQSEPILGAVDSIFDSDINDLEQVAVLFESGELFVYEYRSGESIYGLNITALGFSFSQKMSFDQRAVAICFLEFESVVNTSEAFGSTIVVVDITDNAARARAAAAPIPGGDNQIIASVNINPAPSSNHLITIQVEDVGGIFKGNVREVIRPRLVLWEYQLNADGDGSIVLSDPLQTIDLPDELAVLTESPGTEREFYPLVSLRNPDSNYAHITWTYTPENYVFIATLLSKFIVQYQLVGNQLVERGRYESQFPVRNYLSVSPLDGTRLAYLTFERIRTTGPESVLDPVVHILSVNLEDFASSREILTFPQLNENGALGNADWTADDQLIQAVANVRFASSASPPLIFDRDGKIISDRALFPRIENQLQNVMTVRASPNLPSFVVTSELGDVNADIPTTQFVRAYRYRNLSAPPSGASTTDPSNEPSDEASPTPGPEEVCFPAAATVELEDGSVRTMAELAVGDRVRVSESEFSDIHFFGHKLESGMFRFERLEWKSAGRTGALTLSASHMVLVDGALKRAGDVHVGERLHLVVDKRVETVEVTERRGVLERGLYNPHTLQSRIVVNDIIASCYTDISSVRLAHMLLAPLRLFYRMTGTNVLGSLFETHDRNLLRTVGVQLIQFGKDH